MRGEHRPFGAAPGAYRNRGERIVGPACGWSVYWREYLKSCQGKHLSGGGAVPFHQGFVAAWERARTPRERDEGNAGDGGAPYGAASPAS